ncbi:hypothetical protein [Streptomyces sp. Je 1-4 4N24_ara]|uniref:hypothetical protein n=1 Tax=Streptomyces sp. Je 1-4 4N24_ara TaxID=2993654 RepID=UPI0022466F90|nr:hypothetical protein [Streptomyces sp. Je 1-4 4N24_ara]
MALSLAGFVVIAATYQGREAAQAARSPHVVPSEEKGKAFALWQDGFDTVGGEQYSVIYVDPLTDSAPPPPGLREWPRPGHAVLSPGAKSQGAGEGIATRFGPVDGVIGPEGLASAGEPLVYIRPDAPMTGGYPVSAWGDDEGPVFGEPLFAERPANFYVLAAATALAPALVLTVTAARTGSAAVRRRRAAMFSSGSGCRHRLLRDIAEVSPAIAAGGGLATVVLWCYQSSDWPVPKVGYIMTARFLAPYEFALFGCVALAVLLVMLATVLLKPRIMSADKRRPPVRDRALTKGAAGLCPWAFVFVMLVPGLLGTNGEEWLFLLPYGTGVLTALVTLPALVSLLVRAAGRGLTSYGKSRGRPSALLAGRWVAARPAPVTRAIASIVLALCISALLYTWHNKISGSDKAAAQLQSQLRGSVVQVDGRIEDNTNDRLARFTKALPPGVSLLGIYPQQARGGVGHIRIIASPTALQKIGLPPTPHSRPVKWQDATTLRGRTLLGDASEYGGIPVRVSVGPVTAADSLRALQVVAPEERHIAPAVVKEIAHRHLLPGWTADPPGSQWTSSLVTYQKRSWWLALSVLAMIGLLTFAGCLSSVAEFARFRRPLEPVKDTAGPRLLFVRIALWVFLGTFTVAASLGSVAAVMLTTPLLGPPFDAASLPAPVIVPGIGIITLIGAIMTIWSCWNAVRKAHRWRHSGD